MCNWSQLNRLIHNLSHYIIEVILAFKQFSAPTFRTRIWKSGNCLCSFATEARKEGKLLQLVKPAARRVTKAGVNLCLSSNRAKTLRRHKALRSCWRTRRGFPASTIRARFYARTLSRFTAPQTRQSVVCTRHLVRADLYFRVLNREEKNITRQTHEKVVT